MQSKPVLSAAGFWPGTAELLFFALFAINGALWERAWWEAAKNAQGPGQDIVMLAGAIATLVLIIVMLRVVKQRHLNRQKVVPQYATILRARDLAMLVYIGLCAPLGIHLLMGDTDLTVKLLPGAVVMASLFMLFYAKVWSQFTQPRSVSWASFVILAAGVGALGSLAALFWLGRWPSAMETLIGDMVINLTLATSALSCIAFLVAGLSLLKEEADRSRLMATFISLLGASWLALSVVFLLTSIAFIPAEVDQLRDLRGFVGMGGSGFCVSVLYAGCFLALRASPPPCGEELGQGSQSPS